MKTVTLTAILIDPWKRSIEYVETAGALHDIYKLVGEDCIDSAWVFGKGEVGFVGDHSALHDPPLPRFMVPGYHWPLFGKMLVLGCTPSGKSRSTRLTVEQVTQLVVFA